MKQMKQIGSNLSIAIIYVHKVGKNINGAPKIQNNYGALPTIGMAIAGRAIQKRSNKSMYHTNTNNEANEANREQ